MSQKTISLPGPIYLKLKAKKKANETFADLILRLLNEGERNKGDTSIESFFGVFADDSDEWEEIEKRIYAARNKSPTRRTPRITE